MSIEPGDTCIRRNGEWVSLFSLRSRMEPDADGGRDDDVMTVTPDDLAAVICRKIRDEDDHSHFNGHRLDRDCQGVAPGEHVPAIRTANVWAGVAGALRECGVPFPEEYRALLDGETSQ